MVDSRSSISRIKAGKGGEDKGGEDKGGEEGQDE